MASSTVFLPMERQPTMAQDIPLRLMTPAENYRCPVSTPANHYVQKHSRIRRTKPLMNVYSQPPPASGRGERTKGFALGRHSRSQKSRQTLQAGKSLDYYFVDKKDDKKSEEQTNTHWLKALCSQPVEEILKKYRRKSDVKRTRIIWSKTFTTPGERSLLMAWDGNNHIDCHVRLNQVQSAYENPSRRRHLSKSATQLNRQTQSEPPLSRAQNLDLVSGTVTPATIRRDEDAWPRQCFLSAGDTPRFPKTEDNVPSPQKVQHTILSPKDHSPRMKTYTTQYFAPKQGIEGAVRVKMVSSPTHLPILCTRHRVTNLLQNENSPLEND